MSGLTPKRAIEPNEDRPPRARKSVVMALADNPEDRDALAVSTFTERDQAQLVRRLRAMKEAKP